MAQTIAEYYAEQGLQKGLQKGIRKGKQESCLKVLSVRFGKIPQHIRRKVLAVEDEARLEELLVAITKAKTLHELRLD